MLSLLAIHGLRDRFGRYYQCKTWSSRLIVALKDSPDSNCFLSVITLSELLHGIERATDGVIRRERTLFLDSIFSRFKILPIDEETGRVHSVIWADLVSRHEMIGQHDLWIAATCIRHGHILATRNIRDFRRIPGLMIREVL